MVFRFSQNHRFYWILYIIFFVLLPINAPLEYWDDSVQAALFVAFSLRYLIVLNVSWLITSAHYIWGLDKKHKPSDSNMIFLVTKSYWPQYHYLLPFDYQTGEFGNYGEWETLWCALVLIFVRFWLVASQRIWLFISSFGCRHNKLLQRSGEQSRKIRRTQYLSMGTSSPSIELCWRVMQFQHFFFVQSVSLSFSLFFYLLMYTKRCMSSIVTIRN